MKGYVIELHATFAFKGDSYEDAVQEIFNHIDLNETPWEDSLVKEMTEEEFNKEFGYEEE
jgi:hypothetical protein